MSTSNEEERREYKLTGNFQDKHQLQGQFTDRENTGSRASFSFSATPDTVRVRTDPNELKVARYSGVFSPSVFGELQYSEKIFTFMNSHDFQGLPNSPFFSIGANGAPFVHYNRPYFDGTDPEDRANEQLAGSVSFFLDSASAGSHDLKVGYEDFTSFRTGGQLAEHHGLRLLQRSEARCQRRLRLRRPEADSRPGSTASAISSTGFRSAARGSTSPPSRSSSTTAGT